MRRDGADRAVDETVPPTPAASDMSGGEDPFGGNYSASELSPDEL